MRRVSPPSKSVLSFLGLVLLATPALWAQRSSDRSQPASPPRASREFTAAQLENMQARVEMATKLVARLEADAKARGLAAGWRQATLESLLALPLGALEQVDREAYTVDRLAAAMADTAEDPNLIGDPNVDLVYTPFAPCRYIDTRNVGGKITAAAPRAYDLVNSGNIYGGTGGCGVQENVAAAIAMNVTILDPSGAPGFVAVKPTLAAPTSSLVNWYQAGPAVQVANAGVVTMDQGGATAEFFVVSSESVHVIVDFFGVFQAPAATALQTTRPSTTVQRTSGFAWNFFSPSCPAGYALTGGATQADFAANGVSMSISAPSGNAWSCVGQNNSGVTINVTCLAICSRVPGR